MTAFPTKLVFRYLDLRPMGPVGGRGNAVRLFMLANKISFDEELVSFKDWGATEKAKTTKDLNPAGVLPVVLIGDKCYSEHVSICRYLSRKVGTYGVDAELDFIADAAADVYTEWRNAWATALGGADTDKVVQEYRSTRGKFYATLEWYYAKRASPTSPFLHGGDIPGFLDVIVYNMMWDDALKQTAVDTAPYPALAAMYAAVGDNPEVKAWVTKWQAEARAVAA